MEELREVKEIFDKIASVSGKKDKEKIIKNNKDNELFLECLKFLLDSNITTGLSKKKINKKVQIYQNTYSNIRDMFRILTELDLEYVINSQVLWGEYDTVPSLSICELISDVNQKVVSIMRYHWNGKKRELIINE